MKLVLLDKLSNLVSGVGTPKDKATAWAYSYVEVPREQLDAAFASDWLARKIVTIPARDMTREWREWEAKQKEAMYATEREFHVQAKTKQALTWARHYGGAAILIGDGTERPEEPLDIENFDKGGLKYLHVFNRHQLTEGDLITDINNPDYGKPEFYKISTQSKNRFFKQETLIHRSRFAFFYGPEAPVATPLGVVGCWGMPILQIVFDAVLNVGTTARNAAALTEEAKIDVIKVPDLTSQLATKDATDRLVTRFTLANTLKSTINTLLLGDDEDFVRQQTNLSGLPELIRTHLEIASGAADIPVTRLLGQTPAGLSSTGESDLRNYYDMLRSLQTTELSDSLEPLDKVLKMHTLGADKQDVTFEWAPLWAMSETEKATRDKIKADTVQIYVNSGLFDGARELRPSVAEMLVEDGLFPTLDQNLMDEDEFLNQVEQELQNQQQPPPDPNAQNSQGGGFQVIQGGRTDSIEDASPRTLYVRRDVLGGRQLIEWAKEQGLPNVVAQSDLHVTVAYSREPVDWFKVGTSWSEKIEIGKGGPRQVARFGDSIVLLIPNVSELKWRHEDMKAAGASWDFEEYQPHITIATDPDGLVDVDQIEAYQGSILLGPEIFEEIEYDYQDSRVRSFGDWDPSKHPRDPAGSPTGGQFTSGGGGGPSTNKKDPRQQRREQREKEGAKNSPAVSLFDQTVAKEGIPTPTELISSLPKETRAKIADVEDRLAKGKPTYLRHLTDEGRYTPERSQVHAEILQRIFTPEKVAAATPAEGEKPVAVFLGGRGGSGKSWFTGKDGPVDASKFIYINPDDFKEALPEYEGWNAGLVHEESDDISSQANLIAKRLGVNVIHDATMKSGHKVRKQVEEYKKLGYEVDAYYMFASPKTAATRAVKRFERVGRYVPPAYSLASLTNEATFDSLIPEFRNWGVYDNNHEGSPPTKVADNQKTKDEDYDDFFDEFNPELHPRHAAGTSMGGKFAPKGTGGTGFVPSGSGKAKYFTPSKDVKQHIARVLKVLAEPPAKFGVQYRDKVRILVEEAKFLGYDGYENNVTALKKKIGESFWQDGQAALQAGKVTTANKAFAKATEMGFSGEAKAASPAPSPTPKPETPPQAKPEASGGNPKAMGEAWNALSEDHKNAARGFYLFSPGSLGTSSTWENFTEAQKYEWFLAMAEKYPKYKQEAKVEEKPKGNTPIPTSGLTPTQQQAMKQTPVGIPLSAQGSAEGAGAVKALVMQFNSQWSGKTLTTMEELNQKIADYAEMQKHIAALQLKVQAAAEKKAAEEAAKEAAKYADDPEAKEHFETLSAIVNSAQFAKVHIDTAEALAKAAGIDIKPTEAALIYAYTLSYYAEVNAQLRNGSLTKQQYAFAKALNKALDKLPNYKGTVWRKVPELDKSIMGKYKVGMIVPERSFTSSSTESHIWSGVYTYVIKSETGKNVTKLSGHANEKEVLFKMNSAFIVTKVEGKTIHMEEVPD